MVGVVIAASWNMQPWSLICSVSLLQPILSETLTIENHSTYLLLSHPQYLGPMRWSEASCFGWWNPMGQCPCGCPTHPCYHHCFWHGFARSRWKLLLCNPSKQGLGSVCVEKGGIFLFCLRYQYGMGHPWLGGGSLGQAALSPITSVWHVLEIPCEVDQFERAQRPKLLSDLYGWVGIWTPTS